MLIRTTGSPGCLSPDRRVSRMGAGLSIIETCALPPSNPLPSSCAARAFNPVDLGAPTLSRNRSQDPPCHNLPPIRKTHPNERRRHSPSTQFKRYRRANIAWPHGATIHPETPLHTDAAVRRATTLWHAERMPCLQSGRTAISPSWADRPEASEVRPASSGAANPAGQSIE